MTEKQCENCKFYDEDIDTQLCCSCAEKQNFEADRNIGDKMKSKDIIKALECCGKLHCNNQDYECKNCIFKGKERCVAYLIDNTLGLIQNQQTEIERLEELVNEMSDYFPACINCDGKDNFGARTDKCVYLIDKTNFCAKQGIKNIASIQKENQSLKCELKIAKTEAMAEQWGGSTEKGGAE